MIAAYPAFSHLELDHKAEFTRFVHRFEPYSDFNFVSFFSWNTDGSAEVAWLNGNLAIRMPDYLDGHPVYSLLGDNRIDETLDVLLADAGKLELVPETVIEHIADTGRYQISEDRDNFDYVYSLPHLAKMEGGVYKKKRNKVNVFVRYHEGYELAVRTVTELDDALIQELIAVDRHWATVNPRDQGDILAERKALDRLLNNFSHFDARAILVRVDGELKAFSINEVLPNGWAICHFEKALRVHHENIYPFLAAEAAKNLQAAGCQWVNWEQDLGLAGLRRSKESYHPTRMLRKYTVKAA
jgi:hypothetical protein